MNSISNVKSYIFFLVCPVCCDKIIDKLYEPACCYASFHKNCFLTSSQTNKTCLSCGHIRKKKSKRYI